MKSSKKFTLNPTRFFSAALSFSFFTSLILTLPLDQASAFKKLETPKFNAPAFGFGSSPVHIPEFSSYVFRAPSVQSRFFGLSEIADYVEVDPATKQIRLLEGNILGAEKLSSTSIQTYVNQVEELLEGPLSVLEVNFKGLKLNTDKLIFREDIQFLKFDVYELEPDTEQLLEVRGAQVDFRFRDGLLYQIVNHTISAPAIAPVEHSGDEARSSVESAFNDNAKPAGKTYYEVFPQNEGYVLQPVKPYYVNTYLGEVKVSVDMTRLGFTEVKHKHLHAKAGIKGFGRSYKDDPEEVIYKNGELFTKEGTSVKTDDRGVISGHGVESSLPPFVFNEMRADIAYIKSRSKKLALKNAEAVLSSPDSSGPGDIDYYLNPWKNQSAKDHWAAYGTVYVNLSKIKTSFREIVGKDYIPWVFEPTEVNVNIAAFCNAYWDGDTLNFFQANAICANTANIGEVVIHEFGHGVDENTGGIEDDAYSEGFADLLAFSVYFNPKIGEGFYTEEPEKFIRDLSEFKSYPKDKGESHEEGLIIANTMYDLYVKLLKIENKKKARKLFRTYVYKMIKPTKTYKDVHNFLWVFERDEDRRCLINSVFHKHGLANKRPRCAA